MARTRAKRKRAEGKDSGFRKDGVLVDETKMDRFMKRRGFSADDLLSMPSPANGKQILYIALGFI